HQGGFAGAILADKADYLVTLHIVGKIGKRHDAGVGFRKPGQTEERLLRSRRPGQSINRGHVGFREKNPAAGTKPVPEGRYRRPAAGSSLSCSTWPGERL